MTRSVPRANLTNKCPEKATIFQSFIVRWKKHDLRGVSKHAPRQLATHKTGLYDTLPAMGLIWQHESTPAISKYRLVKR